MRSPPTLLELRPGLGLRPELDGLRALAVVAVIGFHAGVPGFSGGYLGVDVFFVLSGYLIASRSLRDIRAGTFSLRWFWERRIRRIIPALYAMMALTIPFSVAWMLPDHLDVFGQALVASVGSMNNVLLYLTSGYWQLANEFKPLMHTWSLGIEEQVYVLFPAALLASLRWPRATLAVVAAASVASIAWAEWTVRTQPLAAFLLPQARVAEFAAGALWAARELDAAPSGARRYGEAVSLAGLTLLFACVALFEPASPHPGVITLVPIVATLCLVHAARPPTSVGRALTWRPVVLVGLMSYSLYLWHQPVLAFVRLRAEAPPGAVPVALAIALSLVLAYASWRTVEHFGRYRASSRAVWCAAVGGALVLAGTGLFLHRWPGFAHSGEEQVAGLTTPLRHVAAAFNEEPRRFVHAPWEAGSRALRIVVAGDSHARDFIRAALDNGYLRDAQLSYAPDFPGCVADLREPLRSLAGGAQVVVFASPDPDVTCWKANIEGLRALGVGRIVVVGPKNFGWNINRLATMPAPERLAYRAPVSREVLEANAALAAALGPAHYVDQLVALGAVQGRVPMFTPARELVSYDLNHYTPAGARHAGRVLFEHPLLRELR